MQLASLFSIQNLLGSGSYLANGAYASRGQNIGAEGFADSVAIEKSSNYNCYDGGRGDTPGAVTLFNGWDFVCTSNKSADTVTVAKIPKDKTKKSALTLTRSNWTSNAKGATGAWVQIGSKTQVSVTKYFNAKQPVTKTFKTGPQLTVDRVRIMADTINKMFKDDPTVLAISFRDAKSTDSVSATDLSSVAQATTLDITSTDLIKAAGAPNTTVPTTTVDNDNDKTDTDLSGNPVNQGRPDVRDGFPTGFVGLKPEMISTAKDIKAHLTVSGLAVCPSGNISQRLIVKFLRQPKAAGCLDQPGQYIEFGALSTKIDDLTVTKGTKVRIELLDATGQLIKAGRLHAYGDKSIYIINKTNWEDSKVKNLVAQVKKRGVVTVRVTVLPSTDSFGSFKKEGSVWLDSMYDLLLDLTPKDNKKDKK